MGCASSTEVDPNSGKEKKKLGGAYPGNRRLQNAPYMPPQSQFQKVDGNTAQATAHFVAYGKGNALVLVDHANAPPEPATGGPPKEYIQVTLPEGVNPGDTIHVQAPDGRLNAIVVPPGMYAGSTFTVEFASGPPPSTTHTAPPAPVSAAPAASAPPANDDFVSGFNSYYGPATSQYRPTEPVGTSSAVHAEPDIDVGASYPSAPVKPY